MAENSSGVSPGGPDTGNDKPQLRVTLCAMLLAVAHVDYDYHPDEKKTIAVLMQRHYGLSDADMETLFSAADTERKRYKDLWPFVETINESYSKDDKMGLLVMLWQVIYADKRLDSYEELLMRKLQPMLEVEKEMVDEARQIAGKSDPLKESEA